MSLRYTAWHWRECPNCLCFPLAKHPHIGAPPVSYRQYDDLAGLHAFPFYSWWIAAADGFLSLKIPVGRAWWIAPDCSSAHTPSYHPGPPTLYPKREQYAADSSNTPMKLFSCYPPKSLETSAVTNLILSSCVNTNKVGVKNIDTHMWEKKRGGLIWYSHYPPTMHSHDRLTPLISHSFGQQLTAMMWVWRPVMVAEAFNGSITVSSLCRALPFVEYKSVSTQEEIPLMLTTDCSIQLFIEKHDIP